MDAFPRTRVHSVSAAYRNPPMGRIPQPDYINAVAQLDTELAPLELLAHLQGVERDEGRRRGGQRWGARTLDLDLLLHGEQQMDGPRLVLPHPGVHLRAFVIHPLAEIAPDAWVPGLGTAAAIAAGVSRRGLERLPDSLAAPG
jgi:2-amino-4-hydroxy-6-hydroxymethyldihydropteridine diphosphokinase